jgi:PAS domain S-box-containing protein
MCNPAIYLENIVNNLPHFIFWKDKNSRFVGCNQLFAEAAGFSSPAELIGKSDHDMPWKQYATEYIKTDQIILSSNLAQNSYEEEQAQQDDSIAIMLVSKVPIFDSHKNVVGIIGIYMNITERKKMERNLLIAKEKSEAANQAKEIFLQNMRHDLRTPFSGILTLSEWMATQESDVIKKENLDIITQSSRVLLNYINVMLEHAQAGIKPQDVENTSLDLRKIINESLDMIKPDALKKQLHLRLNYSDTVPRLLYSSAISLRRMILNLLGNAIKFTAKGEVSVDVITLAQDDENVTLNIAIADTGIGIPVEQQNIIFEKFTRLEAAHKGNYDGMGLGLYDVKEICRQLGGNIIASSNDSGGSTFTCTLTFKLSNNKNCTAHALEDNKKKQLFQKNLKVLLVEDQEIAAYAAKKVLESEGFDVDIAVNGAVAIEKFNQQKYEVMLLDIGLPDTDGFSLAKQFKATEKKSHLPPTLLFALSAHEKNENNTFNCFDHVLQKPFSNDAFQKALADINNYPRYESAL